MSNSPVIPKEKLSAYQRWELHSFDTLSGEPPAAAARADAEAAEKVRHIHQHAYQAGHADGLREGTQKSTADAQRLLAVLAGVRQQSNEINQNLADDLLGLALEIARQMMRQALAVRPELIVPVIQDALARVAQPVAQATITLQPEDAGLVREHLGAELAADGWRIVEDASLARGGCLLRTTGSQVNATSGARWQHIAAALGQDAQWLV